VLRDFLAALTAGASRGQQPPIFVNAATILPATVKKLAAEAAQAGALLLNCPVFGRPDAAAAGALIAVPAGPAAAREVVAALLPACAGE
jgi:3-hydroxyisobutyrate dehydrogenase-like beta-hydroxyacid dehydrogenase